MASNNRVWIQNGKVIMRNGEVFLYSKCPCKCTPSVLASKVVNGSSEDEEKRCWDLSEYLGNKVGIPGFKWRLIEVGDPRDCGGIQYGSGDIDECGKLVGLQARFCSGYSYDGFMELQQGCPDEEGKIRWPCP